MSQATVDRSEIESVERAFIERVWNGREYDYIDETHASNFVGHWLTPEGMAVDRDGLEAFIRESHEGFSDFELSEEFLFVDGDAATVGFEVEGTHDGEYMGIPPTHERVRMTGIYVHRYEDDEIVEAWASWDALGMLQDLKVVPKAFKLQDFLETALTLARRGVVRRTEG